MSNFGYDDGIEDFDRDGHLSSDTQRFLDALDPKALQFEFQTFDDNEERSAKYKTEHGNADPARTRHWYHSLANALPLLKRYNHDGCGIFVAINETDGHGRKADNITRVRALWVDLDGSPLDPVRAFHKRPHITVESSPGKWHVYWLVEEAGLNKRTRSAAKERHKRAQHYLAKLFGGDRSVCDLPRVMRLPGFVHRKGPPFTSRLEYVADDLTPHRVEDLIPADVLKGTTQQERARADEDGNRADHVALIGNILKGTQGTMHASLCSLAASFVASGMHDGAAVNHLSAIMAHSEAARADTLRWIARNSQISELVRTAREKYGQEKNGEIVPYDFWGDLAPPALPRGLLPKLIENVAFEQGEIMGADPAALAVAMLTVCAAAIPDSVTLQVKEHDPSWTESARLWAMLVGPPSYMKSPVIKLAAAPIVKIDGELVKKYIATKAIYDQLDKEEKKLANPPKCHRLRIDDTTVEAMQVLLQDNEQGVLGLQDELRGWFGSMEKYASGRGSLKDRSIWLQAFDGAKNVPIDRISRGTTLIPNLSVSMLGGIQPEPLREIVATSADDGLIQRFLPIVLRPPQLGHDTPRSDAVAGYNRVVELLAGKQALGGIRAAVPLLLRFSPGAQLVQRRLDAERMRLERIEQAMPKLGAHIGKYGAIFARLCLTFHCIERVGSGRTEPISEELAERVAKFLYGFLLKHAMSLHRSLTDPVTDPVANAAGYILAHKLETITARDLQGDTRAGRNASKRDRVTVLEALEMHGWVTLVPGARIDSAPTGKVNLCVHALFENRAKQEAARRAEVKSIIAEVAG